MKQLSCKKITYKFLRYSVLVGRIEKYTARTWIDGSTVYRGTNY